MHMQDIYYNESIFRHSEGAKRQRNLNKIF